MVSKVKSVASQTAVYVWHNSTVRWKQTEHSEVLLCTAYVISYNLTLLEELIQFYCIL